MIERLLVARRALAGGDLDQAERLFGQVADADERNAMAIVGLAEVALARGDSERARGLARDALAIDSEEAAARRVLERIASSATTAAAPTAAPLPASGLPITSAPLPVAAPSIAARIRGWLGWLLRRG